VTEITKTNGIPKGVYLKPGFVDFLVVEIDRKSYSIDYSDLEPSLLIPTNATSLVIPATFPFSAKQVVILKEIGYTAKRMGRIIPYSHKFKKNARPQLKQNLTRGFIHSLGGEFDFTNRGFVDRS